MRQRLVGIVVFLVVAGIVAGIAWQRRERAAARQDRLVRAFLTVLSDSLSSEHRLEVHQLLHMFYLRAGRGEVPREEVERITAEMVRHTRAGSIAAGELVYFMADVGYTMYRSDPRYNLPDKSVDHPVLNPESGMYPLRFTALMQDSAFMAGFEEWRKEHPELTDTLFGGEPGNYR